jgi:RimJ/RimL family protein N-acetyltransferase
MADAELLLKWRNDPATRVASRQSGVIELAEHRDWLSRSLASPDRMMRIVEESGHPVGVVRADRTRDGWELSWTVAPDARGRGIGPSMVKLFGDGLKGRVSAMIRKGHAPSERVAKAAGLSCAGENGADFDLWERR